MNFETYKRQFLGIPSQTPRPSPAARRFNARMLENEGYVDTKDEPVDDAVVESQVKSCIERLNALGQDLVKLGLPRSSRTAIDDAIELLRQHLAADDDDPAAADDSATTESRRHRAHKLCRLAGVRNPPERLLESMSRSNDSGAAVLDHFIHAGLVSRAR